MNLHLDLYQIELLLKLFKYDKCLATIKKNGKKETKENYFRRLSLENSNNYTYSKKQLLKMTIIILFD